MGTQICDFSTWQICKCLIFANFSVQGFREVYDYRCLTAGPQKMPFSSWYHRKWVKCSQNFSVLQYNQSYRLHSMEIMHLVALIGLSICLSVCALPFAILAQEEKAAILHLRHHRRGTVLLAREAGSPLKAAA